MRQRGEHRRTCVAARLAGLVAACFLACLAPDRALALDFYIDPVLGDDARSTVEAQSPGLAWRTLAHALRQVESGHTIRLRPGTYVEQAETMRGGVHIVADEPLEAIIAPPPGHMGLQVKHPDIVIEGLVFVGGTHGVRAEDAPGLVIRRCVAVEQQFNGFMVVATAGFTIEGSIAASAGSRGIFVDHASEAYLRSNLVYGNGEWGIDVENTNASDPQPPLSTGNVIAFNTVAYNGGASGGGIRLTNAVGEVRDNVVAHNAPVGLRLTPAGSSVHHVLLWDNPTPVNPPGYVLGSGMLAVDPQLADPAGADGVLGGAAGWRDDRLLLAATSPALDAGSGDAASLDMDGTARADGVPDSGIADLGFHAGTSPSSGRPPVTSGPATYYVDGEHGDDTRTKIEAQSPATPWRTITRALLADAAAPNDTVVVAPGIYTEMPATSTGPLTIRGEPGAVIAPPAGQIGLSVGHAGVLVDGLAFVGGAYGVRGFAASGLTVRGCTFSGQGASAVALADALGATIEDNAIEATGGRGIHVQRSSRVHVRSNLILGAGEWGVELNGADAPEPSVANVVADNEIRDSGQAQNAGSLLFRNASGEIRDNLLVGGRHGIRGSFTDGIVIRGSEIRSPVGNGMLLEDASGVLLDDNVVRDAGGGGIVLNRARGVYAHNNLVVGSGEWGIHLDASGGELAHGNVFAFNTVVANGAAPATGGGLRLQHATGEIRDNVVANNPARGIKVDRTPTTIHHNLVFGRALPYDYDTDAMPVFWANLAADPQFADAAGGDYRLLATSPALDAGSGSVAELGISGSARADGAPDTGVADLGRHEEALPVDPTPPPPAPTPTPAPPTPTPRPGEGSVHYVDCATGVDEGRSKLEAQNSATPWRTLQHAARNLDFGEVALVAPGLCAIDGEVQVDRAGVTLRAAEPGGTVVRVASGNAFNVKRDDVTLDGFVIESPSRGVLAAHPDSDSSIANVVLRGLVIRPPPGVAAISTNGIQVRDASDVTVEDCIVSGVAQQGILLKRVHRAYVRNNLVYGSGDWGISLDNTADGGALPLSTGNVVAFNTVYGNVRGLRLVHSAGEIRDNVAAMNGPTGIKFDQPGLGSIVHHNVSYGHVVNYDGPSGFQLWASNVSVDPLFVDPANGDFSLRQLAAGDDAQSPLVDAGSGPVEEVDISGSTRRDGVADAGIADIGFHRAATGSSAPPGGPVPTPAPDLRTVYVDCEHGNDANSAWEAQFPWTAWRTIGHATSQIAGGETIIVRPGVCAESVVLAASGATLRAERRGETEIHAPADAVGIELRGDGAVVDGFVVRADKEGVLVAKKSSSETIRDAVVRNLRVGPLTAPRIATNGIRVRNGEAITIENNVVTDAAQQGIVFRQGRDNYARNNRVERCGEWGIHIDHGDVPGLSPGNVAAFNTVRACGTTGAEGGIRFQKATGEIRDNIVVESSGVGIKTDSQPTHVHHNGLWGNPVPIGTESATPPVVWSNVHQDPLFVDPASGDLRLQHVATGHATDSPMKDAGSGPAAALDISGSTRLDGMPDDGAADLGFHEGAAPSTGVPPIAPVPSGTTYYVDAQSGDDMRSEVDALNPAMPWKTISRALAANGAPSGSTVVVAPGTYAEAAKSSRGGITLRAAGEVIVAPPVGRIGITIDHPDFVVEGFTVQGGLHGIRASHADGVVIRGCRTLDQSDNGLYVFETNGFVLDSNVVRSPAKRGVLVEKSTGAYVRNNLIRDAGEWGLEFKNSLLPASSDGNVVAFNTVVGSGRLVATGGIRFDNTLGEIRDNVFSGNSPIGIETNTAPTLVHQNLIHGSAIELEEKSGQEPTLWSNIRGEDPLFVDPAAGDFRLAQLAAGQAEDSPAVDRGSGDVSALDIGGSTRSDGAPDAGVADLGYHHDAPPAVAAPPPATPPANPPAPGSGVTYYVDPVSGSDERTPVEARASTTPWRTIARAMTQVAAGDVIALLPGTYFEQADFSRDALTLRGEGPRNEIVIAPSPLQAGVHVNGFVEARIENLVIRGGAQGVNARNADGIQVTNVVVAGPSNLGIRLQATSGARIESCIVSGAGNGHGVALFDTSGVYLRNNLIYANAETGVSIESTGAASVGNVIAFNTIHQNGNGIRLLNASGEVRDNILSDTVDLALYLGGPNITVHHNQFSGNGRDRDKKNEFADTIFIWDNLGKSPRYVRPAGADGILGGADGWADDDFRLEQTASGGSVTSVAVDAGSRLVSEADIGGTTRTDGVADEGVADLGYHYGAPTDGTIPEPLPRPPFLTHTYYVDAERGDDTRSDESARRPETPWKTISRALQRAQRGDTVVVFPGTYAETAQITRQNLTLMAETPGTVVIAPASGNAVTVQAPGVTIDGLVLRDAMNHGVSVLPGADGVTVRGCAVIGSRFDGIRAALLDGVTVEDTIVASSGRAGIHLRKATGALLRNDLVYDNAGWGIHLDNTPVGSEQVPVSTGNVVAGSTVAYNGAGNVRLANAIGVVRDNILAHTPGPGLAITTSGATLLHNGFFAAGTVLDPPGYAFCAGCAQNLALDPLFVRPTGNDGLRGGPGWADDDFRLSQTAAGQAQQSAAVDFGSGLAASLGVSGTTATSGAPDTGVADIGFHYAASGRALPLPPPPDPGPPPTPVATPTPTPTPTPGSGTPTPTPFAQPTATPSPTPTAAPTPPQEPTPTPPTPGATPGPEPSTPPGGPFTFFVDPVEGDDARPEVEAMHPGTPWRTIGRALASATEGTVLSLAPGEYHEGALALTVDRLVIRGAGTFASSRIVPDAKQDAFIVTGQDVTLENLEIVGARHAVLAKKRARGLKLIDVVAVNATKNAVKLVATKDVEIRGTVLTGARKDGLRARKANGLTVRDANIYANRKDGIRLKKGAAHITFTTLHANRGAGVRALDAKLTLRDSIVSDHRGAGVVVRGERPLTLDHLLLWNNGQDLKPPTLVVAPGGITSDPLYVDPAGPDGVLGGEGWRDDDLSLSQPRGGQDAKSPAVNAGSGRARALGVTGSTASNSVPDTGRADLGAHR